MRAAAALLLLACAAPRAAPLRFLPAGDAIYKVAGDLGTEDWSFALDADPAQLGALRVEHRRAGKTLERIDLDAAAVAAHVAGGRVTLHFSLPAALEADELVVAAGRALGRIALRRYAQTGAYRLPLSGCWFVAAGHDFGVEHLRHLTRGHFAWDFVRVDADGRAASGPRLADHHAYGQPVLAPADGLVLEARGDLPDNPPGVTAPDANFLLIDHGGGERSRLMHLQQGSLSVHPGDRVRAGQEVARVGNSGMSDAPHLHLAFEDARSAPLPVLLDGYTVRWNQGISVIERGRPRRGQFVCSEGEKRK